MKLLVLTCLKEDQPAVARVVREAGVPVFSITETIGFRDGHESNLLDNWFGSEPGHYDSVFFFSFTGAREASRAVSLVQAHNAAQPSPFPVRAFVLPVEAASHTLQIPAS